MIQDFYSNGKLLLTAEYAILDGAKGLAIPTKFGQQFQIRSIPSAKLIWKSLDKHERSWFTAEFELPLLHPKGNSTQQDSTLARLLTILHEAQKLNPDFLSQEMGYEVITRLEFPQNWGLGSSSTLINSIANWAEVNPYTLLENTFKGSGYDIACAIHHTPLVYWLNQGSPELNLVDFNPPFKDQLHFIHLNKKQDSRLGIAHYRAQHINHKALCSTISKITEDIISCKSRSAFEMLISLHETTLGNALNLTPVKERLFPEYKGALKSLGAWGGDFILATGTKKDLVFFNDRGYTTILSYEEMLK